MTKNPRFLVSLGGGDEIGASSYLLEVDGKRILVDAGMRLKGDRHLPDFEYISQVGMVSLSQCDAVLLTHAHIDHSGSLPAVYHKTRGSPREAQIFSTAPTKAIASILLNDTIKIKSRHGEFVGDVDIQEFEKETTEASIEAIQPVEVYCPFLAAPDVQVTYFPAGHILGAAMALVEIGDFRVLFSGDFSGPGQMTVGGYAIPDNLPKIDVLVCETTYAYKERISENIVGQQQALLQQVAETIDRGGKVLIPAFAVGRAQEVLLLLKNAMLRGIIPKFPVWSDGMVNQVCGVYNVYKSYLSPLLNGYPGDLFFDEGQIQPSRFMLRSSSFQDDFGEADSCCIVASSGMLVNGSCSAKYAEYLLEDEKNKILFTGYLDEESPGRQLISHLENRTTPFRLNQKSLHIHAGIQPYHLSAHADLSMIQKLVEQVHPKQVVFIHGYPQVNNVHNLQELFFGWGLRGIIPTIARNNTSVYF